MYEYASFCFEFSENCRVIPSKRYQHLAGKWQKCVLEMNCLKQFILEIAKKKLDEFPLKYCGLSVGKVCKSCRSRQELSNEYFLAKFGVDTEENEPSKVCSFG